jgi:hypothetical protein
MSGEDVVPAAKRARVDDESFTRAELIAKCKKLEAELQAMDAEHNAKIQARDAAAKRRSLQLARIERQDAELQAMDAKIQAYDAAAKRRSLLTLLDLKADDFVLKQIGNEYSPVKGVHKIATAIEKTFKIFDLDVEKVPLDSTSRILLRLMEQKGEWKFNQLRCSSEADVDTLVNDVLLDAIAILKCLHISDFDIIGDLDVFHERSLFSGRPDILAVRASARHLPLLVVDVKKPVIDGSLCGKEKALGQAFDYGESLRACGHPLPVVVLTSLEASCVCWNSVDPKATELYEEGVNTTTCPPTPQQKKESSTATSASPPTLMSPDRGFTPATQRKLNRSKEFEAYELVRVLCTALLHAAQATQPPTKLGHIYRLVPKSTYNFPRVLRFTTAAKDYTWGSLAVCIGTPIESRAYNQQRNIRKANNKARLDKSDDHAYYLIGRLGHGATSNVWHALDSKGNEVVIKMYVKTTNAKGLELDSKRFEAQAKLATKKEVANFKKIYSFLKEKVYHTKLSDFHCVVMPFFKPVPTAERQGALEKVKEVLTKEFTPKKLKYHAEDVRWSHVGTYVVDHEQTPRHILYNLADLVPTKDSKDRFVEAHLDILGKRMGEHEKVCEHYEYQQV